MSCLDKTHIGLFLPSLHGGGAERVMMNLARGLAERHFNVDLVLVSAEGAYLSQLSSQFRVVDLASNKVLSSLPKLVIYLRKESPAYLLSAMKHANLVALWAKRLAKVPTKVIAAEHNTLSCSVENCFSIKEKLMPYFIRCFYPWADGIVAVSQGVAEDLSRVTGLSHRSIRVIYNPVVTPELLAKAEEPAEHPWLTETEFSIILGVGMLTKQKNFSLLIRAFSIVRRERPAKLLILGEGKERTKLQVLIAELGLDEDVALVGFVENPYSYMAKADLFVLSSNWEGLPTVLIEAMACGTPVISTNCPNGPKEILEYDKYGSLVPVGDEKAMARAILSILNDKSDADILRQKAMKFSLKNGVDQYISFFNGLS